MNRRYLLFGTQPYAFEILRPLQEAARARGDQVAWYLEPAAGRGLHADERQLMTPTEVRNFDPEAVFAPGNWVPHFFPGIKVQVFHGFGIEKKGHFRIRGWFDLYCTHGPLTTQRFREIAEEDGSFAVRETGWPKMDALFAGAPDEDLRRDFDDPLMPLVLYAPTFSRSLTSAPDLAEQVFDLASGGPWNWLVKFHPKMDAEWVTRFRERQGPQLKVYDDIGISPLLHTADILLTDTSSVAAEFLLLDKPVVTYRNASPGPQLIDFGQADELEDMLDQAMQLDPERSDAIRDFAAGMHPYRDCESSARVLDAANEFIDTGMQRGLKRKPLNLWRKLRMRIKSGYFGF